MMACCISAARTVQRCARRAGCQCCQADPILAKLNPREYHSLIYAPGGRHFACLFRNTVRAFDAETLEVVMALCPQ